MAAAGSDGGPGAKKCSRSPELNRPDFTGEHHAAEEEQSPTCLRIVLVGKTGSGKSASGNTILGRRVFKAESSQSSVTKQSLKERSEVNGHPVYVVDTPGLFDTTLNNDEVNKEMVKCISLLAPGPHVFLLVMSIGRLIQEEKETVNLIQEGFGKNSERFTIILLTGGDTLEDEEVSIEEYIDKKCDDSFKNLLRDCGGRYHVFNNWDENNRKQVDELITKINTLVKTNGGSCYTNEMLQEAKAAIQKEMERNLKEKEEEMKREREELQNKHEEEMNEMKRRLEEQRAEIEEERKMREKQLEEKVKSIKKEREIREEENRRRKQEEESQKQEWKQRVKALEQKIRSEAESKENIYKKLEASREEMRKDRENWERKQKEWWEKQDEEDEQRRQKEKERLRTLQEEYEQIRENDDEKRKEEDQIRREQEEKEKKHIAETYKKELEKLKKMYEDEARKRAEEFNEFQKRYTEDIADKERQHEEQYDILKSLSAHNEEQMRRKHFNQFSDLVKCVTKEKGNLDKISALLNKQKEELSMERYEEEKKNLPQKHENEISDLLQKLLHQADTSSCSIS